MLDWHAILVYEVISAECDIEQVSTSSFDDGGDLTSG